MDTNTLRRIFPGTFNFFLVTPEDLRFAVPNAEMVLPQPQRIFLDEETATPLLGFPVLLNDASKALREALEEYLQQEVEFQVAATKRRPFDRKVLESSWRRYSALLEQCTENSVRSSFGRRLPSILWLYHSIAVSRLFKELPSRVRRLDLQLGRSQGDVFRYRIYDRYLDRVLALTYEVVHRVAREAEEKEQDLFPALLTRMRDNVLILTEDHISLDLSELDSYFRGYLRIDGKDLRARLSRLEAWLGDLLSSDPQLSSTVRNLIAIDAEPSARELMMHPGVVRMLSERADFRVTEHLSSEHVETWENLLAKLKEFEILLALRRTVLPAHEHLGQLTCRAPHIPGSGLATRTVVLSSSTRPMDFMTTWVIDPLVRRCGLIYDITDFSSIVSYLGRSGSEDQDTSYRSAFRFQRWVNQLARSLRLQLEKYLGDGALYSGRHPSRLLRLALELQRYYERALREGFPFDRGMRIALNYGEYRLLPIEEGNFGATRRYEFFGHGIVELSRLATGKSMREIDEIKNLLIGLGYPATEVDAFFAPALRQNVDLVDKIEERRRFYSYINPNGTLINEGIVATEAFIRQIEREGAVAQMHRARDGSRGYLALTIGEPSQSLQVGLRKLGLASLKGLGRIPIFEVVDGNAWAPEALEPIRVDRLVPTLESEFAEAKRSSLRVP